jgi:hypothetical protein
MRNEHYWELKRLEEWIQIGENKETSRSNWGDRQLPRES